VRETEMKEKGEGEGLGLSCEPQSEMAEHRWDESCNVRSAAGCLKRNCACIQGQGGLTSKLKHCKAMELQTTSKTILFLSH